jgi:hypothetical protein
MPRPSFTPVDDPTVSPIHLVYRSPFYMLPLHNFVHPVNRLVIVPRDTTDLYRCRLFLFRCLLKLEK